MSKRKTNLRLGALEPEPSFTRMQFFRSSGTPNEVSHGIPSTTRSAGSPMDNPGGRIVTVASGVSSPTSLRQSQMYVNASSAEWTHRFPNRRFRLAFAETLICPHRGRRGSRGFDIWSAYAPFRPRQVIAASPGQPSTYRERNPINQASVEWCSSSLAPSKKPTCR